ncbi:MAG TPA: hypothetical protein VK832_18795 [Burkholderiaceae bacterium]|jgi:hypothetical protein|nr:hypothetical protein [Burkholderiaceae bacterium]
MAINRRSLFALILLLVAGGVNAQTTEVESKASHDDAWFSYRDVYQSMVGFEKYGKPKQFIQHHLQVIPTNKSVSMEGLRLTLTGKSTHLNLPLDPLGRAVFPLLKAAYDEKAELQINRPSDMVKLEPRVSIQTRADGIYEISDLRSGCDQALQYLRYVADYFQYRNKQCVGVKFSYPKDARDIAVIFRNVGNVQTQLSISEGDAFSTETINSFKLVVVRFSDWPDKGQITTNSAPLAIAAIFE